MLYGIDVLSSRGHWTWPLSLVFGVLCIRLVFVFGILAFRSYERRRGA